MRNYVQNPSAEGATPSLEGVNGGVAIVADAITGPGASAYRLTPTAAGTSAATLTSGQRAAAAAGDRWWARFSARWLGGFGARKLSCYLWFQDSTGKTIQQTQQDVELIAPGTFHRWTKPNLAAGGGTFEDGSTAGYSANTGAPTLVNSTDRAHHGTRSLRVTSTSTSTADAAVLMSFTAATAGLHTVTYWVWSAQSFTASFDTEYASNISRTTVPANTWTRVSAVVSINATGARAVYAHNVFGSAVAGNVLYIDSVSIRESLSTSEEYTGATLRTNLAADPLALSGSMATGALGWSSRWFGNGSSGTNSVVQNAADGPFGVTSYARKTWTAVSAVQDVGWSHANGGNGGYPVTPGQQLAVSSYVRGSKTQPSRDSGNGMVVLWYDASGNQVSPAGVPSTFGLADGPITAGQWVRYGTTVTVPAGVAYMSAYTQVYLSSTAWAAGDTLDGTALLVERASAVGRFFSGSTVYPLQGRYRTWVGAPNASPSVESTSSGTVRTNRMLNPNLSQGIAQWYVPGGTWDAVNQRVSGSASGVINTGNVAAEATISSAMPGERRRSGAMFYNTSSVPLRVSLQVQARSSSGSVLFYYDPPQVTVDPGGSAWLTNTVIPSTGYPVGTASAALIIRVGDGNWPTGSSWQVDNAIDTEFGDGADLTPADYFDGGMVDPTLVRATGRVEDVQQLAASGYAPAGTAYATVLFVRQPYAGDATSPASGDVFDIDAVMLTQSSSDTAPPYADPNTSPTWQWLGTANASTSFTTAPDVSVILAEVAPGPRAELRFQDLPAAVGAVNVYRIADGRTALVRGGIAKYATGGAALVDYEAPFGIPITYRAEMFPTQAAALAAATGTGAGAVGSSGFTGDTVAVVNSRRSWIHQPLDPSTAFSPEMLLGTAEQITRESPGSIDWAEGADLGTWFGGQRRGVTGLPVKLLASMADLAQLDAALGRYGEVSQVAVLVFRTPPPMPIPRLFYGTVPDTTVQVLGAPRVGQEVQVSFTSDEAQPIAPGLVRTQLTRRDQSAAYPTRGAWDAAYLTRLSQDSDYDLAGIGG